MNVSAWPNLETCQANAQGRLTPEQQRAFEKPLPFGSYIAIAFVMLLLPGFIVAVYVAIFLPVLIPTVTIHGNSPPAQTVQFILFFVLLIVGFGVVSLLSPNNKYQNKASLVLSIFWFLGAIALTIVFVLLSKTFFLYYGLIILGFELLIALSQIQSTYRARISRTFPILSTEGEVRWQETRYAAMIQGKSRRPLLSSPQILPGNYRVYYYAPLRLLLAAEPLPASLSFSHSIDTYNPLQAALFTALHATPSEIMLHRMGMLAPPQQMRWRRHVARETIHDYFSALGMTWVLLFLATGIVFYFYLSTSLPFLIPFQIPLFTGIALLAVVPVLFARRTMNRLNTAAAAERIVTWSGPVTAIRSGYVSAQSLYYPPQTKWGECRSDKDVIGYLPLNQANAIITGKQYRLYLLASTKEIVSAEIIPGDEEASNSA